ncbi:phosphatase PAP2 family protein [Neptunitalea chrysea]|uniref:Phosphatase PAP2 family protein n=1 Tax=Neptunitalea chrysea TaxID=1647581 RepID=A0A9W6B8X9_9FLAO|nr:phosphatase PAP2 family protein [Neptunitalea chrysea]GLB53729.1 phosphatase PAP2 family protein [Neptunitalea chrysea]
MYKRLLELDTQLLIYLNNLGTSSQDVFWYYITKIVFWIPLYLLFVYIVVKRFSKREALRILYTFIALITVALSLTYYVKEYVLRDRPVNNEGIFNLLRVNIQPIDYSFFSGHACNSFAITALFYLFVRKRVKNAWLFFLWPVLFSYSRIYFAVHFPSDVLVGALVGTTLALSFYMLYKKLFLRYNKSSIKA